MQYPAPGDLGLAKRVQQLLTPVEVGLDIDRGLDHGTWSVLAHAYPRADIPVLQLSIDVTQQPGYHYELGRTLTPLRDEGVLIIGSGNVVHNLGRWDPTPSAVPHLWAEHFEAWVRARIEEKNDQALIRYLALGPDARDSAPTPEHFLPLLYCLGACVSEDGVTFPTTGIENAAISMLSVGLGLEPGKARKPG